MKLFHWPYYMFPWDWVHPGFETLVDVAVRLFINIYTQWIVIRMIAWDERRDKESLPHIVNDMICIWTKSSVFLFAW